MAKNSVGDWRGARIWLREKRMVLTWDERVFGCLRVLPPGCREIKPLSCLAKAALHEATYSYSAGRAGSSIATAWPALSCACTQASEVTAAA